jgi:hypothetical protein
LQSDRPLLNERAVQHIGQCYDLVDPIVNGRDSVKIGDSIWRVGGTGTPERRPRPGAWRRRDAVARLATRMCIYLKLYRSFTI